MRNIFKALFFVLFIGLLMTRPMSSYAQNNGQWQNGQGQNGQGHNGQGNGQGHNGQGQNGQGHNGQGNGQGQNGQGHNGQGQNGQGHNGQGQNGQGHNGQGNGQGQNWQGHNGQGNGQGHNGQGNNWNGHQNNSGNDWAVSLWTENFNYSDPNTPPVDEEVDSAVYQPVIVNGTTYYINNGQYYIYDGNGYQAVADPNSSTETGNDTASDTSGNSITINIPNKSGGFTPVTLTRSGDGFLGPQGEFYAQFPTVTQLETIYGN